MGVEVPQLGKKVRLLLLESGHTLTSLAIAIGRAKATVSGWINGGKMNDPEVTPERGLDDLAEFLAAFAGISHERARQAWMGEYEAFEAAVKARTQVDFASLIAAGARKSMLKYRPNGMEEARLVTFFASSAGHAIAALVGESFALDVDGPPDAQIVLIAQSAIGHHLGAPGPGAPSRIGPTGVARLPDAPSLYQFHEPAGLHTFFVFLAECAAPLAVGAHAGKTTPLTEAELNAFARELTDASRVSNWWFDTLAVDVRRAL